MTARLTIAVLIACHNRRTKTLACLASLIGQRGEAQLNIILFDDGSTDGTADAVRRQHPGVTILAGTGDAFWAGGMRTAFDVACRSDFDFVLWLNDDVVLEPDAVARLLDTQHRLETEGWHLAAVGGAVQDPADGTLSYGGIEARRRLRFRVVGPWPDRPRPSATLHGNVVLLSRRTAETLGSIGAAYVHTLADLDYGLRVGEAGGWVGLAPGFVGTCARNPRADRWFDATLPLAERWRLLNDPKGFPVTPWLAFARAHGGRLWPVRALRPFWRLLLPAALGRLFIRGNGHAPAR